MNNVLILLDNLDDWKPYYETSSVLTVSDYLKNKPVEKDRFHGHLVGIAVQGVNNDLLHLFKRHGRFLLYCFNDYLNNLSFLANTTIIPKSLDKSRKIVKIFYLLQF